MDYLVQNIAPSSYNNPPPSYDDAVGRRPVNTDTDTDTDTDTTDPVVARAYHNQTECPLLRLPDLVLVSIMERMPLVLRTSRA